MLLLNAISTNMLPAGAGGTLCLRPLEGGAKQAAEFIRRNGGVESAVGHADTAALFSALLGRAVPCERRTVELSSGDTAVVGAYRGPRLPEGATALPEGAAIDWYVLIVGHAVPIAAYVVEDLAVG